jgi:hypothetical protein
MVYDERRNNRQQQERLKILRHLEREEENNRFQEQLAKKRQAEEENAAKEQSNDTMQATVDTETQTNTNHQTTATVNDHKGHEPKVGGEEHLAGEPKATEKATEKLQSQKAVNTSSKTVDVTSLRAANTSAGSTVDLSKTGSGKGSFGWGLLHGATDGTGATVKFAKSLTTAQGWKDVGTGIVNTGKMLNPFSAEGNEMRHQAVQGVRDYVKNLPNKSAFELGRGAGFGLYKTAEVVAGAAMVKGAVSKNTATKTPFKKMGEVRDPAITPGEGENVLINAKQGLQSSTKTQFENVIAGKVNDHSTKYLFTIDERGINIALEKTPAETERKFITHTNLSKQAASGGEVWFTDKNTVSLNPKSARFGGASITKEQWEATVKAWESLGYKVEVAEFMPPPKTPKN